MPPTTGLRLIGAGGANRAMELELKRLARRAIPGWRDLTPHRVDPQTLAYPFDAELAFVALNYTRTPSRVLMDLFESDAGRLEPLYQDIGAWVSDGGMPWLEDGLGISVYAREVREFPASASQIQGTIKNAIIDGARDRGLELHLDTERPDLLFSARGGEDTDLLLSLDLAGGSMHLRGYRLEHGSAPLRENLAAQVLLLAKWDPREELLLDPMCGAGTIPIEAALLAKGAPLWPSPRAPLDGRVLGKDLPEKLEPLYPQSAPRIVGFEIDRGAIDAARKNAKRAGVAEHLELAMGDFLRLSPPASEKGLVVANPPYGERLGGDVLGLYEELRDWFERFPPGWRGAFLVANADFERVFGRQPSMKKPLSNGPLKAQLYVYETTPSTPTPEPRRGRGRP